MGYRHRGGTRDEEGSSEEGAEEYHFEAHFQQLISYSNAQVPVSGAYWRSGRKRR